MGMQLGIEFAARVVVVNSDHKIAGYSIILGTPLPHPGGCIGFKLL